MSQTIDVDLDEEAWVSDSTKKLLAGMIVGFFLMAMVATPVFVEYYQETYHSGFAAGHLDGKIEAFEAIDRKFGSLPVPRRYETLFSLKAFSVVGVSDKGVRTLRVLR
ncbi:MAG: hypothetical protein V3W41_15550 [Planctomycetota bacterium]